jgi:hypothetical protein
MLKNVDHELSRGSEVKFRRQADHSGDLWFSGFHSLTGVLTLSPIFQFSMNFSTFGFMNSFDCAKGSPLEDELFNFSSLRIRFHSLIFSRSAPVPAITTAEIDFRAG